MGKLIYIANMSLDAYTEDAQGDFQWGAPGDEVFAYITDLLRPVGMQLLGRRMYETMAVWETDPALAAQSDLMAEFARVWQASEKVVYSTTLESPVTAATRLERSFEPDAVRALKTSASNTLTIAGPTITARAFSAGLVDECHLFVYPMVVGAGKAAFLTNARIGLELLEQHRFDNGVLYQRYRTRN